MAEPKYFFPAATARAFNSVPAGDGGPVEVVLVEELEEVVV